MTNSIALKVLKIRTELFQNACKNQGLTLIQTSLEVDAAKKLEANNFLGFQNACKDENLEIVKYLFETFPEYEEKFVEIKREFSIQ